MEPELLIAGATLGVAAVIVLQNLWLREGAGAGIRAGYAAASGVMTFGAAGVVSFDGSAQQLALLARGGGTMLAAMLIVPVLAMTSDRVRPPRWLVRGTALWAGAGLLLAPHPAVHAIGADGAVAYGPLFLVLTVPLAVVAAVWVSVVVRHTTRIGDRVTLLAGVGVPVTVFFSRVAVDPSGSDDVWVWMLAPLLLAVEVLRWQSVRADASARERGEQERARLVQEAARTNRELQAALRVRNDLLIAASHELRTPLTAISGFAETLANNGEMLDAEARDACARLIVENTARLRLVVEQLLAARELAVQAAVAQTEHLRLAPLLSSIVSLYAELDARTILDCPQGAAVEADPLHLGNIITALVSNAAEHGAPPVRITVRSMDGGTTSIVVQDAGPGVPAEVATELFTPFAQGTSGTSRRPGGLGLGLFNAAELAQLNDGTLRHVPTSTGACFELQLPTTSEATLDISVLDVAGVPSTGGE